MHAIIQFIAITHAFPLTIIKALLKVMMNKYLLTYLLTPNSDNFNRFISGKCNLPWLVRSTQTMVKIYNKYLISIFQLMADSTLLSKAITGISCKPSVRFFVSFKLYCLLSGVYFDKQMGALHAVNWSKSFASVLKQVFSSFSVTNGKKKGKYKK